MTLYLAVTPDRMEYIINFAESRPELARRLGVPYMSIVSKMRGHGNSIAGGGGRKPEYFIRTVEISEDNTEMEE